MLHRRRRFLLMGLAAGGAVTSAGQVAIAAPTLSATALQTKEISEIVSQILGATNAVTLALSNISAATAGAPGKPTASGALSLSNRLDSYFVRMERAAEALQPVSVSLTTSTAPTLRGNAHDENRQALRQYGVRLLSDLATIEEGAVCISSIESSIKGLGHLNEVLLRLEEGLSSIYEQLRAITGLGAGLVTAGPASGLLYELTQQVGLSAIDISSFINRLERIRSRLEGLRLKSSQQITSAKALLRERLNQLNGAIEDEKGLLSVERHQIQKLRSDVDLVANRRALQEAAVAAIRERLAGLEKQSQALNATFEERQERLGEIADRLSEINNAAQEWSPALAPYSACPAGTHISYKDCTHQDRKDAYDRAKKRAERAIEVMNNERKQLWEENRQLRTEDARDGKLRKDFDAQWRELKEALSIEQRKLHTMSKDLQARTKELVRLAYTSRALSLYDEAIAQQRLLGVASGSLGR